MLHSFVDEDDENISTHNTIEKLKMEIKKLKKEIEIKDSILVETTKELYALKDYLKRGG